MKMRKFEISASPKYSELNCSNEFLEFISEIEREINRDIHIIRLAKNLCESFTDRLKEVVSNRNNRFYTASMVEDMMKNIDRCIYIRNIRHNKRRYRIEIDCFKRVFTLEEMF